MKNLYLVRHGLIERPDGISRCISRTDYPLSEAGRRQAEDLGRWLQSYSYSEIYSSPLQRCFKTAEIIANENISIETDKRLLEVDMGIWENLSFDEIRLRFPHIYYQRGMNPGYIPAPEGEAFWEVGRRMLRCLTELMMKASGDTVIVSHGGANRSFLCQVLGTETDRLWDLPQPYGCLNHLRFDESMNRFEVRAIGMMPGEASAGEDE